jgi:hypothetical protein
MSSSIFTARRGCGRDRGGRQSHHNRRHAAKGCARGDPEPKKERRRRHRRRSDRLDVSKALFDRGVSRTDGIYTIHANELLGVIARAGSAGYRFSPNLRENS